MERGRRISASNRRLDDIILIAENLYQAIRTDGDLLAEKLENSQQEKDIDTTIFKDLVDDDVRRAKVIRQITLAVSEIGDLLYPYTHAITRHPQVAINTIQDPQLWKITLSVPSTFSPTTTSLMKSLIEELVVDKVLVEWMDGYFPDTMIQGKLREIADKEEKIRAAKDRRTAPVRRRGTVY